MLMIYPLPLQKESKPALNIHCTFYWPPKTYLQAIEPFLAISTQILYQEINLR